MFLCIARLEVATQNGLFLIRGYYLSKKSEWHKENTWHKNAIQDVPVNVVKSFPLSCAVRFIVPSH